MKRRWFVGVALLAACGAPPAPSVVAGPEWVEELLALDPTLGGAELLRRRLREEAMQPLPVLDDEATARRHRALCAAIELDQPAIRARLRQQLDEAAAAAVLAFLRSDAGRSAAAAELVALTLYSVMAPEEFRDGSARLADPGQVGAAARRKFADLQQSLAGGGGSPSPPRVAWLFAAIGVTPDQARHIGAFCYSPVGQRWRLVQQDMIEHSRLVLQRLRRLAIDPELRAPFDDFGPLPRAEFDDAPGGEPDGGR
ncbi:MAG: hypothetical protein R3F29_14675 [Planctomycetota bacterium]